MTTTRDLVTAIMKKAEGADRLLVAIAGAPGSGKSTQAARLNSEINSISPGISTVIPMDGFHLDNAVLDAVASGTERARPKHSTALASKCC